jgi:hypothetical protein
MINLNNYGIASLNILGFLATISFSFAPFVSFISLAFSGLPLEALAFIGIFTGLISGLQLYLIIEIIASHVPTVNI